MSIFDVVRRALNTRDDDDIEVAAGQLTLLQTNRPDVRDAICDFFDRLNVTLTRCAWSGRFVSEGHEATDIDDQTIHVRETTRAGVRSCAVCDHYARHLNYSRLRDEPGDTSSGYICTHCSASSDYRWSDNHSCYYHEDNSDAFEEVEEDEEEEEEDNGWSDRLIAVRGQPPIRDYSTNPIQVGLASFIHEPDERLPLNPLWMGVELEVEPREGHYSTYKAAIHAATHPFAIMKKDSSLNEGGIEIVSVPATLASHRRLWQPFFRGDPQQPLPTMPNATVPAAQQLVSWTAPKATCGMHVHVSRDAMTPFTFGRALVFVTSDENRSFIQAVAGRASNTYAEVIRKKVSHGIDWDGGRHEALTASSHTGSTYELRIFRGNVREEGFFKNLEFAHALFCFAAQASVQGLGYRAFLTWLQLPAVARDYPVLIEWCRQRNWIAASRSVVRTARVFDET